MGGRDYFTEEVIQAILTAKEALEKKIEERDDRDIKLIDNLCSIVHGFDDFPKTVRRALAAHVILIVIDEKGKELIVHNEELDSFCVLIFGECQQLDPTKTFCLGNYRVGDAFGICEPTTETIRFYGHMITRCENCAFLCVKRDDFYTILTDPANYPNKEIIRHRDRNGNVICISQLNIDKKSSGSPWASQVQPPSHYKIILPDGHMIVKATEECLLISLIDGYDRVDPEYIDDFLLLFRVFMSHDPHDKEIKLPPGMVNLCLSLINWLDQAEHRDRVVKIILTWLSSYYHDFELNPSFSYLFFKFLESRLSSLSMSNQLHLLHVTLSAKSRTKHVTLTKSSREQPLSFSISGGYEKNCGIFVTRVYGLDCDNCPRENFMKYLGYRDPNHNIDQPNDIQKRNFTNRVCYPPLPPARSAVDLKPGDQILEVNGTNFAAINLYEAKKKLEMATHLSLIVRYNPSAYHEMQSLPEGRRKSSLSSISSVSPFQPPTTHDKFNFLDGHLLARSNDQPSSPLFSSNANFGFKSIIKSGPKNDKPSSSRLTSLTNFTRQLAKHIRESSTVQTALNNLETMSKTSDNISDDQTNDSDIVKSKSNPDIASLRSGKERHTDSPLSTVVKLNDLNLTSVTDQSNSGGNQTLVNVLQVFNAANNDSRYLLIHEETTAREVVMVAVREFHLTASHGVSQVANGPPEKSTLQSVSSLDWHLYEVSVVPESRTIKQKRLPEQMSRLADRASLCSRFYIKNNCPNAYSGVSRLDTTDDSLANEILKESPLNLNLTSLNATLLAVELTLADFDKFRSIEPQQFVYDTFFNYDDKASRQSASQNIDCSKVNSSGSDNSDTDLLHSLNKTRLIPRCWMDEYQNFADISNKEMFWVVCEILNERNLGRRVKLIKQFIRIADVCSQLRNYNSMFAIISGLGHSCVNRLKRTFDKLKPKYKNQLEKMRALFDPSKNMSNYRFCLQRSPPPAIPLFPQIKKDLTFTKEGRSIFVSESNDLSDDEDASFGQSHDTIRRKETHQSGNYHSGNNLLAMNQGQDNRLMILHSSKLATTATNHHSNRILINFAEIRQFTKRVRNVTQYSSIPYSNDLLTNTRDSQRNQAQVKKMHEEWQMRKRIRHYIEQTLESPAVKTGNQNGQASQQSAFDQVDATGSSSVPGKVIITYDERTLYQRSLDVEPELSNNNNKPTTTISSSASFIERQQPLQPTNSSLSLRAVSVEATSATCLPQVPPAFAPLNMQAPYIAQRSPTLSKSSSLSSCSSFSQPFQFNYHPPPRGNLVSSTAVGKFGTESTESLRKLQALSENVDDWRPFQSSQTSINRMATNTSTNSTSLGTNNSGGDQTSRSRNLVSSRIFLQKNR